MTKQTARNNKFLKEVKRVYNEKVFKRVSELVNEGKQDLVKFALNTDLYFYIEGLDVAQKLLDQGFSYNGESVERLFEIYRNE